MAYPPYRRPARIDLRGTGVVFGTSVDFDFLPVFP
jgi:hypothetical protein